MAVFQTFLQKRSLDAQIEGLTRREKIHLSWMTGFFLFLFMVYFQPFGVNNYRPDEAINTEFLFGMTIFSFATSAIIGFNELVIFRWFINQLTRLKALLWILWSILFLSVGLFITYNLLGNWHDWRWSSFVEFIFNITALSVLPISGTIIYLYIKSLKHSLNRAYQFQGNQSDGETLLQLIAENEKDFFSLKLSNLLYLQSDDNYVTIYYLEKQEVKKFLLRNNLKALEAMNLHETLIRCHRSFMINLFHLQQVSGNRNKLVVKLKYISEPISVGRQYADRILSLTQS